MKERVQMNFFIDDPNRCTTVCGHFLSHHLFYLYEGKDTTNSILPPVRTEHVNKPSRYIPYHFPYTSNVFV